ncbi:hypothetical protein FLL45_09305 [Aliikangiella marina]|uniref:Scaffold protein FimL second domain-containing protein n=1 Tax=Aliikangiella marina TaxID=1712262 RepID=A0A545TD28_9GAMM|nr:hypothetical protein [Aliikangiella marina]TQV75124.1 hypothetical protein FLL45_09305 [Aliikangiella marina]
MSQVSSLQSLDLILEDVSAEINLSINGLEQYSKNSDDKQPLKKTIVHLKKLKGVFTLLEMQGAQRLVSDAIALVKSLPIKKKETRQKLLEIVTTALARLMRYTEHVNQKPYDMPQLLLPAINNMRSAINATTLSESTFFKGETRKPRANLRPVMVTTEESAEQSRHFRQMYQIGFIEVLRQTNVVGGLKMMQRAMKLLDEECPRPNSPNLWWIAQAMLDGYVHNALKVTKTRLKMLARLDLQIRQVENKPTHVLNDNRAETRLLAKEMLYLTSISGAYSELISQVLAHFEIEPTELTDKLLRQESEAMRGPSDKDYSSIAETLLEEIMLLQDAIHNSQENEFEPLDLPQTLKQLTNLNSLLKILQVDDQTVRLSVAIDLLTKAIEEGMVMEDKDINILKTVLESISKVVNESELAKYSSKAAIRRSTLSPEKLAVCEQAYKDVQLLIKEFLSFTKQNRKQTILKNVKEQVDKILESIKLLDSDDATQVMEGCRVFLEYHLTKNPHSTSEKAINLFADIVSSIEFYLETLKFTAKPNKQILEFAQDSLLKLNRETKSKS